MDNNNASSGGLTVGVGIPSVVIGVLIALKKIGITTMSYWDIALFGMQVFLVFAIIGLSIWFIIVALAMLFSKH
jgi:hypothetical protein